ncbi:MAG: response regulator transcription factor [Clostridia bacterium]|nr:response regulator transcription factor [Clostridia bacterium]
MDKRILLVEDEARMREIISDFFMLDGFEIHEANNGQKALELFEEKEINLVILDIMIPDLDGWTVCRRIRTRSSVPIIMLTARGEEEDKLMGYELGADDYMTKPFSPKVLLAKAKMLLKRVEGSVGRPDGVICSAGIEINKMSRNVRIEERIIDLAPKEYELLLFLIENKGRALSREIILDRIWGYDYLGDLRTVDTHVKKLRAKLGEKAAHICTLIRSGYKFEEGL